MPKTRKRHPDPIGEAWHADAASRWADAVAGAANAGDEPINHYDPQPLPTFTGPDHVTRPLLGRYLHDRDTNVVHDTAHALASCGIDAIRNATFVHFASELETLPPDVIDCTCMGA